MKLAEILTCLTVVTRIVFARPGYDIYLNDNKASRFLGSDDEISGNSQITDFEDCREIEQDPETNGWWQRLKRSPCDFLFEDNYQNSYKPSKKTPYKNAYKMIQPKRKFTLNVKAIKNWRKEKSPNDRYYGYWRTSTQSSDSPTTDWLESTSWFETKRPIRWLKNVNNVFVPVEGKDKYMDEEQSDENTDNFLRNDWSTDKWSASSDWWSTDSTQDWFDASTSETKTAWPVSDITFSDDWSTGSLATEDVNRLNSEFSTTEWPDTTDWKDTSYWPTSDNWITDELETPNFDETNWWNTNDETTEKINNNQIQLRDTIDYNEKTNYLVDLKRQNDT